MNRKERATRKPSGRKKRGVPSGQQGGKRAGSTVRDTFQEQERHLRSVITGAPIILFALDRDGTFTLAEGKGWERLGWKPAELVGRSVFDVYPNPSAIRKKFGDALAGGMSSFVDRLGDRIFETYFSPFRDEGGNLTGVIGVATDVTEQEELEELQRVAKAMLASVSQGLPVVLWTTDRDLRVTSIEGNAPIFLNIAKEANLGRTLYDLLGTGDSSSPIIALHVRGLGGKSGHVESGYRDREYRVHVRPLRDDRDEVVGCVGMAMDVTQQGNALEEIRTLVTDLEQRVLERTAQVVTQKDELERANEQLGRAIAELEEARRRTEEASTAKSKFLTHITHELRTPLNSVIGFANVLLKNKEGHLSKQDLLYLEKILANAKHLLSVINQMLDLSRIEAGRLELTISSFSLQNLVHDTMEEMRSLLRSGVVGLLADVPAETVQFRGDEQKLKQVLINLLGNALKFTERGSVVIRVTNNAQHRPVRIDVVDTGIGIPENKLKDIFEAFEQAGGPEAADFAGTGLGLTISRSLCRVMGYDITVTSEVGKGSTFSVILEEKGVAGNV